MMNRTFVLGLISSLCLTHSLQAGLLVAVGNTSIQQGGTAFVDVVVSSDSADLLNNFNFQFQISGGTPGGLSFVNPQSRAYLSDSSYVFFGDSADLIQGSNVGTVSTTITTNDTYSGSDNLLLTENVTVSSSPQLLVRLEVQASSTIPINGSPYSISLISSGTSFYDFDFDAITPVNSSSGTVSTVTEPSTVPEPSTIVLGTIALATSLGSLIRRNRQG